MKRVLTLSVTVSLGGIVMGASNFGAFGPGAAYAQSGIPERPILTTPAAAERIETDSGFARVLAGEADTKGAFVVMDSVQEPGRWTDAHEHGFAESFYVVEGTLTVQINGGEFREMPPGSYVFIPGGVRHAQGNKAKVPVRTVLTTQPAGLEKAFRQRQEEFRKNRQASPK